MKKLQPSIDMKRAVLLILLLLLSGCSYDYPISQTGDKYTLNVVMMDTYVEISAYGRNAKKALEKSCDELERLEALLSVRDKESQVFKLNREKGLAGDDELAALVRRSIGFSELTEGAFDITVYPLMKVWGFDNGNHSVPEKNAVEEALSKCGYKSISVKGNEIEIGSKTEVDFGGIAKGYASDVVCAMLADSGVDSAIISLGGNISTLGRRENKEAWNVAIESPFEENEYIGIVKAFDTSVVTSGGYRRFFEKDGKKYHHIIDMKTGYPAEKGIASVTVVTGSGMYADALSTAIYTMGIEEGLALRERAGDFELVIVGNDKTVYVTEGLKNAFVPSEESNMKIVWR